MRFVEFVSKDGLTIMAPLDKIAISERTDGQCIIGVIDSPFVETVKDSYEDVSNRFKEALGNESTVITLC